MSSRRPPIEPAQESLLVANRQSGEVVARTLAPGEGVAVPVIERNLDLMNCLGQLAAANMRQGFLYSDVPAVEARYGARAAQVLAGAERNMAELRLAAQESFRRATGHYAMLDAGEFLPWQVKRETDRAWAKFYGRYGRPQHHDEAQDYLGALSEQVTDLRLQVAKYNRFHGLRPHQAEPEEEPQSKAPIPLKLLHTRARMQALLSDPRAQFIPASNREKNTLMAYLDYFDNPAYPLGVNNQLFEVYNHQQRLGRHQRLGARSVESIVWEIGDYLADAAESYQLLEDFAEEIAFANPRLCLAEELSADHPGLIRFVRYDSLMRFMRTGDTLGLPDPLLTKEYDRHVDPSDTGPGKHKSVASHYVLPRMPAATERHVAERAAALTFKEARKHIGAAIRNEVRRASLLTDCLHAMSRIGTQNNAGEYRNLAAVRLAALANLAAHKDAPVMKAINYEFAEPAA